MHKREKFGLVVVVITVLGGLTFLGMVITSATFTPVDIHNTQPHN